MNDAQLLTLLAAFLAVKLDLTPAQAAEQAIAYMRAVNAAYRPDELHTRGVD